MTGTLTLTTTQIGTLTAVQFSAGLPIADLAAVEQSIADDQAIRSSSLGPAASSLQGGIIFGGVTTTTLSSIVSISLASPATATIEAVTAGQYVYGFGIAPGTRVLETPAAGTTTIQLSTAPLAGIDGHFIAVGNRLAGCFQTNGFLNIPNRGVVKVLPGDIVAVGPSGEVFLLPQLAIDFPGSPWIYTP